jgi:hypothetical protein
MIRIRPFDVGVFSGEQINEPGKWLVALGRDAVGGVVIAEADSEGEATRFLHDFVAALEEARAKRNG